MERIILMTRNNDKNGEEIGVDIVYIERYTWIWVLKNKRMERI